MERGLYWDREGVYWVVMVREQVMSCAVGFCVSTDLN